MKQESRAFPSVLQDLFGLVAIVTKNRCRTCLGLPALPVSKVLNVLPGSAVQTLRLPAHLCCTNTNISLSSGTWHRAWSYTVYDHSPRYAEVIQQTLKHYSRQTFMGQPAPASVYTFRASLLTIFTRHTQRWNPHTFLHTAPRRAQQTKHRRKCLSRSLESPKQKIPNQWLLLWIKL